MLSFSKDDRSGVSCWQEFKNWYLAISDVEGKEQLENALVEKMRPYVKSLDVL